MTLFIIDVNNDTKELFDGNDYTTEELEYISKKIKANDIFYGSDERYSYVKERLEFVSNGDRFDEICLLIFVKRIK